jgi:hypothetical protein
MADKSLSSALPGNRQGDQAEVSRGHSRRRMPMQVAHRLETSREKPRGNRRRPHPAEGPNMKTGKEPSEFS